MNFSTRTRYSLRALIDLAAHEDAAPVKLREIAARQNISLRYLRQLAMPLEAAGIIRSTRGAKGGYSLARSASEITVGQVARVFEGSFAPASCLQLPGSCSLEESCAAKSLWTDLKRAIDSLLDGTTIADIAARRPQVQR